MPYTTAKWTATSGGNWATSTASWQGGVPAIATAAAITGVGSYVVTLNTTAANVASSGSGSSTVGLTINSAGATLDIASGGSLAVGNSSTGYGGLVNITAGTLQIDAGGSLTAYNTVTNSASIDIDGGNLTATGLTQSGSVVISGGTLDITGTLAESAGSISISGGTLEAGTLAKTGGAIGFTASGGTLEIGNISGTAVVNLGSLNTADTVFWNNAATAANLQDLTLANFFNNDVLEVATTGSVTNGAVVYSGTDSAGTLTITGTIDGSGFTDTVYITTPGIVTPTSSSFTLSSGANYLEITSDAACFLRGTRIATLRGEIAVEDLRIGDLVVNAAGGALPVKWIGSRGFVTRMVNPHHRAALLPIRIAAGALGEACPVRDLYVSPEHRICLDDVLIPAGKLLNGSSITRAEEFDVVQYFHVELPRHAVLYAEGAPAESFLDAGNRNMFANVLSYLELGHDLDTPPQPACLPIVTEGETLAAVRARLAKRAARTGLAASGDDDLHLLVDGVALRPEPGEGVRFAVPAGARQVRIVSRSVIPAELDPANGDLRQLGVCFSGLSLRDGGFAVDLAPGYAGFTAGFHAAEDGHRWTDGNALLPDDLIAAAPDGFVLELKLVRTDLRYPAPMAAEVISLVARRTAAQIATRRSA